jgi:type II secretory pathway pseudopilin PulG
MISIRELAQRRGFTLVETVMAMASVGVVGLSIFYTLYYGLLLYTKNSAMNVSHQEARMALLQLESDVHQAVSPLSLTDSNGNMISGTAANAGVEFQLMLTGTQYCQVSGDNVLGQPVVNVAMPAGYPTPAVGTRLIVPAFETEYDISSISVSGSIATCTLSSNISNTMQGNSQNIPCFFSQRVYYYVSGSNGTDLMLYYQGVNKSATYDVGAVDLTNATPFSIPTTSGSDGAPNYHAVTVTGLNAQDPQTTALNSIFHFSTSNIMLNGQVPTYSTVTTYQ